MEKDDVIMIFNELITGQRNEVSFSRGYKVFEEIYKGFKNNFNLQRKEEGYMSVITYVK